jgi:GNAT superfamily N-acetyltransferase
MESPAMTIHATTVTTTVTYLHIPHYTRFRPAYSADAQLKVVSAHEPLPEFYRFLYGSVGRDYHWVDRLRWSDETLRAQLARPSVSVHVLYYRGTPAGYIELEREAEEPGTEVAYFGLISAFHGRGFGKHLLSWGVQRAFDDGAERVWLHTCTLDGPHALANYQARGFAPYRSELYEQPLPALELERAA